MNILAIVLVYLSSSPLWSENPEESSLSSWWDSNQHLSHTSPLSVLTPAPAYVILLCDKSIFLFQSLFQAVWMRFFPAIVELRKQLAAGVIGEVKYIQATMGFRVPKLPDHLSDPKMKASSVLEVGVYPINFATMIFGEKPESVQASGWLTETGVDEFAAINLRYFYFVVLSKLSR